MNFKAVIDQVLQYIKDDRLEKALDDLDALDLDQSLKNQIILIQNRYNNYCNLVINDTISDETKRIERSKIAYSLILFSNKVAKSESNTEYIREKNNKSIEVYEKTIEDLFKIIKDTQDNTKRNIEVTLLEKHYMSSFYHNINYLQFFTILSFEHLFYTLFVTPNIEKFIDYMDFSIINFEKIFIDYINTVKTISDLQSSFNLSIKNINTKKQIISYFDNRIKKQKEKSEKRKGKEYENNIDHYNNLVKNILEDIKEYRNILLSVEKKMKSEIQKEKKLKNNPNFDTILSSEDTEQEN